jgi:hypothetical protein
MLRDAAVCRPDDSVVSANGGWCANVPDGDGCVPFAEFNTRCWDGAGAPHANEPLQAVATIQPSLSDGRDVAETPICDTVCLTDSDIQ